MLMGRACYASFHFKVVGPLPFSEAVMQNLQVFKKKKKSKVII